jgi:single-strand DNA-binding protein
MLVNSIRLIGHVGLIETRTLTGKDGIASSILNFSLATQEGYFDKEKNEYIERSAWHKIVIFGKYAKYLTEKNKLTTGDYLMVEGRIRYDTNKDEAKGVTYHNTSIIAEELKILKKKGEKSKEISTVVDDESEPPITVSEDEIPF